MKRTLSVIFMMMLVCAWSHGAPRTLMEGVPDEAWQLTEFGTWTKRADGSTALQIVIKPTDSYRNETYGAKMKLDLTPYLGKNIVISAVISGKDIPEVKSHAFSPKLMLACTNATGTSYKSSSHSLFGTFPESVQELSYKVPETRDELGSVILHAGIQNNAGTVMIHSIKLEVRDFYAMPYTLPEGFRCEYTSDDATMLRGAGVLTTGTLDDARALAGYGANLMRWWIKLDVNDATVLDKSLDRLANHLPEYEKLGLKVIPILTEVPGARYSQPLLLGVDSKDALARSRTNFRMFYEKEYLDQYVDAWRKIARRFKGSKAVFGYSLFNEPTQSGKAPYNYLYCQYQAALAVREIDADIPLFIAANEWDCAKAFGYLKPLPLKDIYYEVHMYVPHVFTHQGVGDTIKNIRAGKFITYPGLIDGVEYNKELLRRELGNVVKFQQKYGARIYVGEFSAIRWAPGAAQYLNDVCELFEEYGWSWAYHCFREWMNWSLEYPSSATDNKPAVGTTDRLDVIRRFWKKNTKSTPWK